VVEIGFGRGEFLLDLAEQNPDQPFLGIEYSAKRVLKLARRLARTELTNVRLIEAPAQDVVADALPDEGVAGFWVNFPDPWPKKRHFKRRLIQPEFVVLLTRRLVPGGWLEFATDHEAYAEWVDEILSDSPELANLHAPRPWLTEPPAGRKPTAYELEWRAQGRGFHFFSYQRRGGP
jgi:tRNA (guanine-N7-)-methyltransferase